MSVENARDLVAQLQQLADDADSARYGTLSTRTVRDYLDRIDAHLARVLHASLDDGEELRERVEAVLLKWWPDADDPRARDLIRAMGRHTDPYCLTHCGNGVRHSQCGCRCDHSAALPERQSPVPDARKSGGMVTSLCPRCNRNTTLHADGTFFEHTTLTGGRCVGSLRTPDSAEGAGDE